MERRGEPLAWHRVTTALSSLLQPTVAAIDGPAVGGGCLIALACTLRIASERATVGPVEFDMGVAGTESTSNLVRLAGPAVAAELQLTGRELTASDAKQVGLLNDVFPTAGFHGKVREWCHRITENPPSLLLAIKRTIAQETGVCCEEAQPLDEVFGTQRPGCGSQR